jgi:hypothetical protein
LTVTININTVLGEYSENVVGDALGIQPVVGKPEVKKPLGRPMLRWESHIKMAFKNWDEGVWAGLIWLRIQKRGGLLEQRTKHLFSFKCWSFLDCLKALLQ